MDISIRIASWLRVKGRSQAQLAVGVGVRPSAVSMWISGATKPTEANREAMAAWLGLTMSEFYGDVPELVAA